MRSDCGTFLVPVTNKIANVSRSRGLFEDPFISMLEGWVYCQDALNGILFRADWPTQSLLIILCSSLLRYGTESENIKRSVVEA